MKYFLPILLCFLFEVKGDAQNLVPNGSFEDHDTCPNYAGEIWKAIGWSQFRGTPDYMNVCGGTQVGIPNNLAGQQEPHTGSAYAGFQIDMASGYREMLGCQLLAPLVIGNTYYIHFFVSAGIGGYAHAGIAANKLGLKFTTVQFTLNNPIAVNNTAHFFTNTIITDTINWTELSGTFIADSAYQFIAFGDFFDNTNTDTIMMINTANKAYYYIDDICISPDSNANCDIGLFIPSMINDDLSLSPNPAHDNLQLQFHDPQLFNRITAIDIYNVEGLKVLHVNQLSSSQTIDISNLPVGMYELQLLSDGNCWNGRFIKE